MTISRNENGQPLLRPFAALRPADAYAAEVAAPPYDVLSQAEARASAEGKRWSFLHASRAEIDFPPDTDPHSAAVYARAAENINAMTTSGVLVRDPGAAYYVYRLAVGGHTQTGIAAAASITAYDEGRIRRHEFTRADKEDDRVRQIEAVNAHTGPIFVVHRADAGVAAVIARVRAVAPDQSVTTADGVVHDIWVVSGPDDMDRLEQAFAAMDALYIADGHHRAAAASRVAAARARANPAHRGDESYNSFLTVSFPDDEVRILDYNRTVGDLNGQSVEEFLGSMEKRFTVEPDPPSPRPEEPHQFGMYVGGRWYRLGQRSPLPDDPSARLDVNLLNDRILGPVLGVGDARSDRRLQFIGANRGMDGLRRLVDNGEMAVAFALYPTTLSELMAVVDSGAVLPPKSTWFDPKLADGLLSLVLD